MIGDALASALFADPTLSEPATYTPAVGAPVDTRAIRATRSADFRFDATTIRSDATTFKLPSADVPAPVDGDTLTVAGQTFTIQGTPARAMRGAAWQIEAVPA